MVSEIHRINNTSFSNNRGEIPASMRAVKYRIGNYYSVIEEEEFSLYILQNDDVIHSQYTNYLFGEGGGNNKGGISEAV